MKTNPGSGNRILRRLVALLTVFVFMSSGIGVLASSSDTPSTWARAEVDNARAKGLVTEDADSNFQSNISRRLFCALVVNMVETVLGSPVAVTITNPFEDTNDTDIVKAYQLGIVNGISATLFAPDASITREQIAAMMMRGARKLDELQGTTYSVVSDAGSIVFADQNEISTWALDDVKMANHLNIMLGMGENTIVPQGNTMVEQGILLISRLYDGFTCFSADTDPIVTENLSPQPLSNPVIFSTVEQSALFMDASQLASDPEGDALTIIEINGGTGSTATAYGSAELTGINKCRYISEDITSDTADHFVVTVTDGVNQTEVNIKVDVITTDSIGSNPPVARSDPFILPDIQEQVPHTYFAANFAEDADGDILRISAVNGAAGTVATSFGNILLNSNGTITYTSNDITASKNESFTITITDGISQIDLVVKGTVVPRANTVPQALANPVVFNVQEKTALLIAPAQLASDADGDTLTITEVSTAQYGTAVITSGGKGAGRISYTSNDITEDTTESFQAVLSDGQKTVKVNIRIQIKADLSLIPGLGLNPTLVSASIRGIPSVYETLIVGDILYQGIPQSTPELHYLWMKSNTREGGYVSISGATGSSYVIKPSDIGKYITVKVTANGAAQGAILCSGVGAVTTSFNGGNGTAASPYQIATAGQLLLLDNVVPTNGKHFKLISDIELYRDYYVKAAFYGVLDGNGHTVTINADIPDDAQSGGVFAHIASAGRVSDLTVTGSINSTGDGVGGIAGYNQGTISGCISQATITADNYVGGIAGKNSGTIEGCSVRGGSITGDSMLGGLAGINYSAGIITNCYSHADIYMYANAAGGLLGWNQGTVRYCYSTGEIHDGLTNKGGLVGYKESGNISDCYYDKDTSGRNDTGKGIPKTTAEMKTKATYEGWDFVNLWSFSTGQYPSLR